MGVILLDKIKVHELAKKLKINSKDVIEKAKDLGISLKSHLSTITDEEAKKITNSMKKGEKNEIKKEVVSDQPVIMRRTVIINDEEEKQEEKKVQTKKADVGFVDKNRKKDYNIVYRNKQSKPMSVAELFGIPDKKKKEETKQEQPKQEEKIEEVIEKKEEVVETKVEVKQEVIVKKENTNVNTRQERIRNRQYGTKY